MLQLRSFCAAYGSPVDLREVRFSAPPILSRKTNELFMPWTAPASGRNID